MRNECRILYIYPVENKIQQFELNSTMIPRDARVFQVTNCCSYSHKRTKANLYFLSKITSKCLSIVPKFFSIIFPRK